MCDVLGQVGGCALYSCRTLFVGGARVCHGQSLVCRCLATSGDRSLGSPSALTLQQVTVSLRSLPLDDRLLLSRLGRDKEDVATSERSMTPVSSPSLVNSKWQVAINHTSLRLPQTTIHRKDSFNLSEGCVLCYVLGGSRFRW